MGMGNIMCVHTYMGGGGKDAAVTPFEKKTPQQPGGGKNLWGSYKGGGCLFASKREGGLLVREKKLENKGFTPNGTFNTLLFGGAWRAQGT